MGLLTNLLLLPLMGPVRGVAFIAQQVQEAADAGLLDEDQVQAELLMLNIQRDAGQISEVEYDAYETELLDLLDAMRMQQEGVVEPEQWIDDQ